MAASKKELIEQLYKTGAITFEEAIMLGNETETTKTTNEKDSNILVKRALNELFSDYEDVNGEMRHVFDYDEVLKYYSDHNWKWFNTPYGITLDDLKEAVKNLLEYVVNDIKKREIDGEKEPSSLVSTGGLRLDGWVEDGDYVFDLKFIPISGEVFIEKAKLTNFNE